VRRTIAGREPASRDRQASARCISSSTASSWRVAMRDEAMIVLGKSGDVRFRALVMTDREMERAGSRGRRRIVGRVPRLPV